LRLQRAFLTIGSSNDQFFQRSVLPTIGSSNDRFFQQPSFSDQAFPATSLSKSALFAVTLTNSYAGFKEEAMELHEGDPVVLVYNPVGGSAKDGTVDLLDSEFTARKFRVIRLTTTKEHDSAAILTQQAIAMGAKVLVSIGGDGTAGGVAKGAIGSGITVVVYTGGTANLFATNFNTPLTPEQFVNMVVSGERQPVDLMQLDYVTASGETKTRYVLVGLGLGKLSDAISNASPAIKRAVGEAAYFAGVSAAALRPQPTRYRVVSNGHTEFDGEASAVFVLNIPPRQMATVARGCNANDGKLDLVMLLAKDPVQIARAFGNFLAGKLERSKFYRKYRRAELTIHLDAPMVPNIDGDAGEPTLELRLTAIRDAVHMVLAN
jgi:diacylglycerol kinase (ATP)